MDFQLDSSRSTRGRDWVIGAFTAIAFFLLGWFSLANDRDETVHSAYIWLAGGIAVGVLWVVPPRRWMPVVVGLLAAMGGLIIEERSPAVPALAWTLAEIAGAVAAGLLLRRFAGEARLDSLNKAWRFLVAGALAYSLVGSLLAPPVFAMVYQKAFGSEWRAWMLAHFIGVTLVGPIVVTWAGFRAKRSGGLQRAPFWTGLACLAGMLLTALAVFDAQFGRAILGAATGWLSQLPLPYVPLAFAVLVSLAWGQRGGSLALLVLALIAILNTAQGQGPFMAGSKGERLLDAEIFVGVAALLGLFVSALRAREERALQEAAEWKVRYEAAAQASHVKLYELDPSTQRVVWGGDATSWLGVGAREASLEEYLERVHPEDRPRVELAFAARLAGERELPPHRYRLKTEDGGWVEVEDTGGAVLDFDDSVHRVAGSLRLIGATR
jgi:integral membrane sensor domain MASE1